MSQQNQTTNVPIEMPVPLTESIPDNGASFQEEPGTALMPSSEQDIELALPQQSNFVIAKQRRMMKDSYTGAEQIQIEDLDQRQGVRIMQVQGCHIQHVPARTDETTGEVKKPWNQILFKLVDGRVVSAGGVMAEDFARGIIDDLGEYDWPEPVLIVVRMHKGKQYSYPKFQTVEYNA